MKGFNYLITITLTPALSHNERELVDLIRASFNFVAKAAPTN
jgi:hypothetical protein